MFSWTDKIDLLVDGRRNGAGWAAVNPGRRCAQEWHGWADIFPKRQKRLAERHRDLSHTSVNSYQWLRNESLKGCQEKITDSSSKNRLSLKSSRFFNFTMELKWIEIVAL
jgi:hypothetical protein